MLNRKKLARAAYIASKRMVSLPRAPLATRGFYGLYSGRGRNELKIIDNPAGTGAAPAAGVLILLNGVSQGTDYTNRIGRKILLKSLLFRFTVVPTNTVLHATQGDVVRLLLIYDCQTNAATPAVSDVLASVAYNAPMNLTNRDRFKILADKYYTMASFDFSAVPALVSGSPRPVQSKVYKKMSLEEIFGGTGATVGSIQTGAIWALVIALNGVCTYVYDSRVRFLDA